MYLTPPTLSVHIALDHIGHNCTALSLRQVWDLKDLGLQAAQRILGAADPLRLLTEISQNFPGLAESLSKSAVDPELRAEAVLNSRAIQVPSLARTPEKR